MSRTCILALALACGSVVSAENISLNGSWDLSAFPQPDAGAIRSVPLPKGLAVKTYSATVPGCCELELVKAGELPDPMVGMNNFAFRAYEGHQWLYSKRFVAPKVVPGESAVLAFDGIDTLADVFLNGEKIGSPENMLVGHEFDVTDKIRQGAENLVQVLIRPVGLAARDMLLGELGYAMTGGADHERVRKAPYMYGWDTTPRLPVSGIWRDVRLEVRPAARIEYPAWIVRDLHRPSKTAGVSCRVRVRAPFSVYHHAKVVFSLSRNGKEVARSSRLFLGPHVKCDMWLRDVAFWWPAGAGEPALYDAGIALVDDNGKVLAKDERKIGIRTVELEYDDRKLPERPGKFLFKINGEPIYVRGTDWIPTDVIPSRQNDRNIPTLEFVKEMNCNLVRVWGGGVYEPDSFYEWCDCNGVMVWQDFMMACTIPPQDDEFCAMIRKEALSVVLRLRNHASLVLWAGDNENDLAGSWTLGKLRRNPNENRLTRKVIPDVLFEHDVTRPYLPSSPYVSPEAYAGKADPAEDHLWSGPRTWWKTKYYVDSPCWFCSEGGGFGLPSRASLEKMLPPGAIDTPWKNPQETDWQKLVWTDAWQHRGTCPNLEPDIYPWNRISLVPKMSVALWGGVPKGDIDTFIEQSQIAHAEAIKFQVEHFRGQKFTKKGGFVVWNVRDAWPMVSDAVSDWYGDKKKAFYAQKMAQAEVLLMITEDGVLRAVNDRLVSVSGRVKVTDKATGRIVFEGDYAVSANGVTDVTKCAWSGQGVYAIDYTVGGKAFHSHYLYGAPPFEWKKMSALLKGEYK